MTEPVVISFVSGGLSEIGRAFDTIETRIIRLEKTGTQHAAAGAAARVRIATGETKDRERAMAALEKESEKWQREGTRATEREAKRREGIIERSATMAGRFARQQAETEIRAAQEATRQIEREEQKRARARERYIGAIRSGTGGMISGAASMGFGLAAGASAFMVADTIHTRLRAERSAALLVNAVTTGRSPPPGATVQNILSRAGAVAVETGMNKDEIVQASLGYARSAKGGDFGGVMANMRFFAQMAKVTGADMGTITSAAGTIQSQNPNISSAGMQQMLLGAYAASKTGSLSMVQQAEQAGKAGSMANAFQGDLAVNQRKLLGLMQIVAPRSPDSAGMFVMDFVKEVQAHRETTGKTKGTKDLGVKFDANGLMTSPEQAILALIGSSKGDFGHIDKLLGSRGSAVFDALRTPFIEGQKKGGMSGGLAAVTAAMNTQTQATMSQEDLQAQFQQSMSTSAEKFSAAVEQIKNTLEGKLEPYMARFADKLPELLPKLESIINGMAKLADFFANNPLLGIGNLIALSVMKDIAGAAIGMAVKSAILAAMTGGGGGGGGAALGTAGTGLVGRAGAALGLAGGTGMGLAAGIATPLAITGLGVMGMMDAAAVRNATGQAAGMSAGRLFAAQNSTAMVQARLMAAQGDLASMPAQLAKAEGRGGTFTGEQVQHFVALAGEIKALTQALKDSRNGIGGSGMTDPSNPARHNPIDQRATPR